MGGMGPLQLTLRPPQPQSTVISGSPGVQILPQPLILQGNGGGFVPVQLTLRTQLPQVVSSSPSLTIPHTPLLGAFSSPSPQVVVSSSPSLSSPLVVQSSMAPNSQARLVSPSGQTIVFPSQNIFAPRQNIVLSRPGAPFLSSQQPTLLQPSSPSPVGVTPVFQIQTPNGPMWVTLQTQPSIPNQQSNMLSSQSTPMISTNLFGSQTNSTTDLSSSAPSIHPSIITTTSIQSNSVQGSSTGNNSSSPAKGVNLADLLKESGILESSPPSSPTKEDTATAPTPPLSHTPAVIMMPPGATTAPHNLLITPQLQNQATPQLRLMPDGRLILQGSIPGMDALIPTSHGMEKPQLSPDSTTPDATVESIPSSQPVSSTKTESQKPTRQKKTKKGKGANDASSKVSPSVSKGSDWSPSTTVIRIGNCDRLVQTSTLPVILPSSGVVKRQEETKELASSTTVTTSGPVVTISVDDHEFFQRLQSQINTLSASPESLTSQQKDLLQELQSLQKLMSEARLKKAQSNTTSTPVNSNGTATSPMKVLIAVPPRIPLTEVPTQSQVIPTHVLNANTQATTPSPNIQLVNILNQGTSANSIHLLTTSASTPEQVSTSLQHVPQIITFTSPTKAQTACNVTISQNLQNQLQKVPPTSQSFIQVVQLQTPAPCHLSTTNVVATGTVASPEKSLDPAAEKERRRQKTVNFFKHQLESDQRFALKPFTKTPFKNRGDACKRLIRYHVFKSQQHIYFDEVDKQFEDISVNLLIKKQNLFDRFQRCLLRQSMKSDTHESIMLNKLFVTDETNAMKFDREVVAQGIPLDLPPPPKSWQNAIHNSTHVEGEREQISRKRSFLDDNLSDHVTEVKRPPPPIKDDDETEEDEEYDSDNDEDDDDDDTNLADDMSEYLGPHDTEHVDINAIYDEITYDQNVVRSSLDFTFCNRSTSNDQWNSSFGKNTTTPTAWRNFNDAEAAVAVDSILSSEGEEEESVQDISVDLSGLAEQPETGVENTTFPSTFNELENGLSQQQNPETCDPQMQCAIDSILMDVSGQASNSSNPYFVPQGSFGRGYSTSLASGISAPRSMVSSFGHPLQGQVSDPALDEAVKSILS